MINQEILKMKIREAFIIKSKQGKSDREIHKELSEEFYKFITREAGFTREHISKGINEILTEKNRNEIIIALAETYFDYLRKNPNPSNKYDISVKDKLRETNNTETIIRNAFKQEHIMRMRRSICGTFYRRIN